MLKRFYFFQRFSFFVNNFIHINSSSSNNNNNSYQVSIL